MAWIWGGGLTMDELVADDCSCEDDDLNVTATYRSTVTAAILDLKPTPYYEALAIKYFGEGLTNGQSVDHHQPLTHTIHPCTVIIPLLTPLHTHEEYVNSHSLMLMATLGHN